MLIGLALLALVFKPSILCAAPAGGVAAPPDGQTLTVPQSSTAAQTSPDSVELHPIAADSIEVHAGQFDSAGKPVEDFYCAPRASGAHPAVILLHGAVPRGFGDQDFALMCRQLAAAGYYAMFVEYYSQAGPARQGDRPVLGKGFAAWINGNFPAWTREIVSAIDVLSQNPTIERDRIALIGFSLGAFLALAVGASEGGRVAAIVEYYGVMNHGYRAMAKNMPPTLILHGSADKIIPVRYAYDLDRLLTSYNRPHQMKIYPGAGHGLDTATRVEAWQRTLDFLRRYLGR
jgi:carboxymethylenebutenolidase